MIIKLCESLIDILGAISYVIHNHTLYIIKFDNRIE